VLPPFPRPLSGQSTKDSENAGGKEAHRAIRSKGSGRREGGGKRERRRHFSSAIRRSKNVKEQCEYLRRAYQKPYREDLVGKDRREEFLAGIRILKG